MIRFFQDLVDPFEDYEQTNVPPRKIWPFLWSMTKPLRKVIILALVFSIAVAVVELWLINLVGELVNRLSDSSPATVWADHGMWLLALAGFVLVLRPMMFSLHILSLFNGLSGNVATVVRWRSHRHVSRQSIGWFENDFAGRIGNRISQTPSAAEDVAYMLLEAMVYAATYAFGAIFMMAQVNWQLSVPIAIWLCLYIGLLRLAVKRVTPAAEAHSAARSKFTGRIVDSYTNIHSVKMFAHHDREEDYIREAIVDAREAQLREMAVFSKVEIMLMFLNGAMVVAVIGWAVHMWSLSLTTIGVIAAASALVLRLNAMTGWIMWATVNLFQSIGVVREGMETIAQPIELLDAPDAAELQVETGGIHFDHVTHHYGRESGGLDEVELRVQPGEKIGLIGRSGAGKSTMMKLLLRFYDIELGRVTIDGQDIAGVSQESLRRHIGMVSQDSALLHRSIRDNLLYGSPGATEEQMISAAKKAEAHDFILDLVDSEGRKGYDALVGERGVKLSGGQRQRVALARVILKDAPILILDEATSALDSEVEAAIQGTLAKMMDGKTVIAIAHRLSTIAQMDRIVVLDKGRIIEDGSHDDLRAQGGVYAGLWARQSGGFIGVENET